LLERPAVPSGAGLQALQDLAVYPSNQEVRHGIASSRSADRYQNDTARRGVWEEGIRVKTSAAMAERPGDEMQTDARRSAGGREEMRLVVRVSR
jgi:hypothetical protein